MGVPVLGADQVERAARILREGGLVAFPTDTVYGVAALADSVFHSAKLQAFKGGRNEPFSLHLPDVEAALEVAGPLRELEEFAVSTLGPRGVTVIVAHGPTHSGIGLRIVQHESGSKLLSLAGAAVVATSANIHGQPPLNDPDQIAQLPGIDVVLSSGVLPKRPASTVVRLLRCGIEVLRAAAVDADELVQMFSRDIEFICLGNLNRSAFAAGLMGAMQSFYQSALPNFVPAWRPTSCGLIGNRNARPPQLMQRVAKTYGVELEGHVPKCFTGKGHGLQIAMGEDTWQAVPNAHRWSVTDPMGGPDETYAAMAMQVRVHLESLLARTARVREPDVGLEASFDVLFSGRPETP